MNEANGNKRMSVVAKALACGSVLVSATALAGPAVASPSGGHCPPPNSGYIVWDVSTEPYQADNQVDAAGNNDGFVCAKPMNKTFVKDDVEYRLYNFIDDTGTGAG